MLVLDAHKRVMHNGVGETLAELRSNYWLLQRREFIQKLIYKCVVCRKLKGKPCQRNPAPPLPHFHVERSRPFQTTGVDFAGPLYVSCSSATGSSEVWLCLYTCCSTRAAHLDMTASTFLRSFKRFTARRGIPSRMISDNGKTFKSASVIISKTLEDPEVQKHFSQFQVV